MSPTRSRSTRLFVGIVAMCAIAGCSADDGDRRGSSPAPATSSSSDEATATPSPAGPPATLVEEPNSGTASCVPRTRDVELVSMYDPIARASGDVTITAARAVGNHVRVVAAEGVVVTSRPSFGPGVLAGDTWPITGRQLRKKTDVATRQGLVGMELSDGQRVLPLVRVRVGKGATLDSLELSYTDADDNAASVLLQVNTRFPRGVCAF